jgi:hypothetical protein
MGPAFGCSITHGHVFDILKKPPALSVKTRHALGAAGAPACLPMRLVRASFSRVWLNPSDSDAFPFFPRPPLSGSR